MTRRCESHARKILGSWKIEREWGSILAEIFLERRPGFGWVTVTKLTKNVWRFRHKCRVPGSIWRFHWGFGKVFFSAAKNSTFFLKLGTNVTWSRHFLDSAWNKPGFENLAKSRVPGVPRFGLGTIFLERFLPQLLSTGKNLSQTVADRCFANNR